MKMIIPSGEFTVDEFAKLNPDAKQITLRVRLAKLIESGEAVEVRTQTNGKLRPRKIFRLVKTA
jgi:hypothetical protein